MNDDLTRDSWAIGGRLGYVYVPYGRLQQGRMSAPNPSQLAVDVHLATVQLTASTPTSTTIDVQLPLGSLTTTTLSSRRRDSGAGDLELRVRQGLEQWVLATPTRVSFGASAGWVVPTGTYVPRSGAANLPPEASFLALGRGVHWALAELDSRVMLGTRGSLLGQASVRLPLHRARDAFAWGTETRGTLVGQLRVVPWLSAVVSSDVTWRGGATEPDPFDASQRLVSANVGGWQWTASPGVVVRGPRGLSASIGVRIPVLANVTGNQLVPQIGGYVSLSYSKPLIGKKVAAPSTTLGVITVVDYWAAWCTPCATIDRLLSQAQPRWKDVKVVRVDATSLGEPGAPLLPDGAAALPVIEIFGPDGRRAALLTGDDALRVVQVVDELRRKSGTL